MKKRDGFGRGSMPGPGAYRAAGPPRYSDHSGMYAARQQVHFPLLLRTLLA